VTEADEGVADDRAAVVAANEALYTAVEEGDLDRLTALWVDDREPVCVHPGAAAIRGRDQVLRSWAFVMASTDYIQFFLTDVQVSVTGDVAVLTCMENVLTGGADPTGNLDGGRAQAVNVFARSTGGWRVWAHQSSPVGSGTL
jgi:ketosteroid isomerase-like protein